MRLGSTPNMPFAVRLNLGRTAASARMDALTMVGLVVMWYRIPGMLQLPGSKVFVAIHAVSLTLSVLWRQQCCSAPQGGSYARWREVLITPLGRLCPFGFRFAWYAIQAFLLTMPADLLAGGGMVSAAKQAVLLLLISGVPTMLLLWFGHPVRIFWAAPADLALLYHYSRANTMLCSMPVLAHPAAQQRVMHVWHVLYGLHFTLLLPTSRVMQGATAAIDDAVQQCGMELLMLQLMFGFALPAVLQAAREAALFGCHQEQRLNMQLPPELGWQARAYGVIQVLFRAGEALQPELVLVTSLLGLGIVWEVALLLAPPSDPLAVV